MAAGHADVEWCDAEVSAMPRIRSEIVVNRPVAGASEVVADERDESSYSPQEHPTRKLGGRVSRWVAPAVTGAVAF